MKRKQFFKVVLITLSIGFLTACGKGGGEAADQVINQSKQAIAQLDSGKFSVDFAAKGEDQNGKVDLKVNLDLGFDKKDEKTRKTNISLGVNGSSTLQGNPISGVAQLNAVTVGDDYYVRLEKLDVNDPSVQAVLPFVKGYFGKWLHVASDFIPAEIRQLSQKDDAALAKEAELKNLFVASNLISVNKEFGVESVNGKKAYHYGVQFNVEGIKQYMRKAALINQPELTDAELQTMEQDLDRSLNLLNSVSNAEIWIGVDDYYPYKGSFVVEGDTLGQDVSMRLSIDFAGEDFNKSQKIEAPAGAEEFNPLSLLLGVNSFPVDTGEAGGGEAQ